MVQGFCALKIKIIQFPRRFRLNFIKNDDDDDDNDKYECGDNSIYSLKSIKYMTVRSTKSRN